MGYMFNADEVFKVAIQIEENGKNFYEQAQTKTTDEAVKKLFLYLAQEEVKHKEKFSRLKELLPESAREDNLWDPENEINQYLKMLANIHIFSTQANVENQINKIKDAEDALKMAMEFEKDSIVFFLTMKDVTADANGKNKIDELVKEEQEHLKKLTMQLKVLHR